MAAAAGGGSGGAAAGSPAGQGGRAGAQGRPADTEGGSAAAALPGFDSADAFVKVRGDGAWGSGGGGAVHYRSRRAVRRAGHAGSCSFTSGAAGVPASGGAAVRSPRDRSRPGLGPLVEPGPSVDAWPRASGPGSPGSGLTRARCCQGRERLPLLQQEALRVVLLK